MMGGFSDFMRERTAAKRAVEPAADVCETCAGTGQTLTAVMLPSGHTERMEECPDCEGTGEHP